MRFKLDENLSPSLASLLASAGHDAHSITEQGLGGRPDERVIEVCKRENRALITFDLDFSNIVAYPPKDYAGLVVLRLNSQAHPAAESAVRRVLSLLATEALLGRLWIVEETRIRIQE